MANKESDLIFEAYTGINEKVRNLKGFEDEDTSAEDNVLPILGLAAAGGAASAVGGHLAKKVLTKDKEESETKEEDDLGLGPNTPSMVRITSIGSTTPFKRKTEAPIEDEAVYIQAGEKEEGGCDDCGCEEKGEEKGRTIYDGEIDMARLELLKANEYAAKLFHHIGNHPESDYLEGWVASKITKAADYLSSVYHYLDYEDNFPTKEPCYSDEEEKDSDQEEARKQDSVELDTDKGTQTAMNTGFGGAEDDEDDTNDELELQYHAEGKKKGLKGKELEDYIENKMTQPGPHG